MLRAEDVRDREREIPLGESRLDLACRLSQQAMRGEEKEGSRAQERPRS